MCVRRFGKTWGNSDAIPVSAQTLSQTNTLNLSVVNERVEMTVDKHQPAGDRAHMMRCQWRLTSVYDEGI
jgi:hypothetical protein